MRLTRNMLDNAGSLVRALRMALLKQLRPNSPRNTDHVAVADDILDDCFHGCAFAAYVEIACATGGPPDSEATRRLAFKLYEEALAERRR